MPLSYKAKICGNTNLADARLAADAGADFFGVVVEVDFSPRALRMEAAVDLFSRPPLPGVALVYQMPESRIHHLIQTLNPFAVQFLGDPDPERLRRLVTAFPQTQVWQSLHLPPAGHAVTVDALMAQMDDCLEAGVSALLLDTAATGGGKTKFGGTGITFDWDIAGTFMGRMPPGFPVWLAGGINPDNVRDALSAVDPYGIDLCSGVEAFTGKKDPDKVNRLMDAIRAASAARR
ncbi:N-(5'-phosphoribosyl)anthranilate isomerase [Desulfosarcina cetonica]|uniref:phosphoribosylanthranilate isomerase n=1 Tax=Desulfosarcina cetonica TaxID=90730 RepID=UPI0006D0F840|nr:phosphoribosylanthranilate isomerase [Desulfosarcina cetonica]VTR69673.1 N-(5'-phosphoribosyl)anthranilate isomerase [Desulfosarcina cetonica]